MDGHQVVLARGIRGGHGQRAADEIRMPHCNSRSPKHKTLMQVGHVGSFGHCTSPAVAVCPAVHRGTMAQMWLASNGCRWLDANPSLLGNGLWGDLYAGTARQVIALMSCSLNPSSHMFPSLGHSLEAV